MNIDKQKSFIGQAVKILEEVGLGNHVRLESIVPVEEGGYDVGISCRIGEPNLFGEEKREIYLVRLDSEMDLVKLWRKYES